MGVLLDFCPPFWMVFTRKDDDIDDFHGLKFGEGSSSNGYQYSNFEDFCFEMKEF